MTTLIRRLIVAANVAKLWTAIHKSHELDLGGSAVNSQLFESHN